MKYKAIKVKDLEEMINRYRKENLEFDKGAIFALLQLKHFGKDIEIPEDKLKPKHETCPHLELNKIKAGVDYCKKYDEPDPRCDVDCPDDRIPTKKEHVKIEKITKKNWLPIDVINKLNEVIDRINHN
jgi:hypothetical protein